MDCVILPWVKEVGNPAQVSRCGSFFLGDVVEVHSLENTVHAGKPVFLCILAIKGSQGSVNSVHFDAVEVLFPNALESFNLGLTFTNNFTSDMGIALTKVFKKVGSVIDTFTGSEWWAVFAAAIGLHESGIKWNHELLLVEKKVIRVSGVWNLICNLPGVKGDDRQLIDTYFSKTPERTGWQQLLIR